MIRLITKGAARALNNLASVAINASLLFDTDNTYDLGSAAKNLKNIYSKIVTTPAVAFPAAQAASGDANTLDDYEEGTFNPVLRFGGASVGITYSTQVGFYTKVGRAVFFTMYLALSSKGSSAGDASIAGLPFTNIAGGNSPVAINLASVTFLDALNCFVWEDSAVILLYEVTNAGVQTTLTNTDFVDNSSMKVSGLYFTA